MGDFSTTQTSFLGGEWSQSAQGKIDDPRYRVALDTCRNCVILEEGACARRPGFMELGPTNYGLRSVLLPLDMPGNLTVFAELSSNPAGGGTAALRFWAPANFSSLLNREAGLWNLLPDTYAKITSISLDSPAVLTISGAPSPAWATNDVVYPIIEFASGGHTIQNRQLQLVKLTSTTYQLYDMVTGTAIDGSTLAYTAGANDWVAHVKKITAPAFYYSAIDFVSTAQMQDNIWFFIDGYPPYILTVGASISTSFLTIPYSFTWVQSGLTSSVSNVFDGPYADPPKGLSQQGNDTASLSSVSSTTPTITTVNNAFSATDVGRQIRVWSQPNAWASGTTYSQYDVVTYQGAYYTMSLSGVSAGVGPGSTTTVSGVSYLPWTAAPNQAVWRYGVITAYTNATTAVLAINKSFSAVSKNGTNSVETYQLGAYYETNSSTHIGVWPIGGAVHAGRLWLYGAVENRFDASASNAFSYAAPTNVNIAIDGATGTDLPFFSPTDEFGTVSDGNGISYTLNAPERVQFLWMTPDHEGLIIGTLKGEWLISAPTSGPLSPSNIEINLVSTYGSSGNSNKPVRVGGALLFCQTLGIQVIEYLADVFKAGKYVGRHLNADAKHLSNVYGLVPGGIKKLAYQEEVTPTLWAVTWDNRLVGMTYRRNGTYASQAPDIYGWHRHDHGTGRTFYSIAIGGSGDASASTSSAGTSLGNRATLLATTKNTTTGVYYVEMQRDLFRETDTLSLAYLVDGIAPLAAITGTDSPSVLPTGCSAFGSGSSQGADVLLSNSNLTATGGNVASNEIAQSCQVTPGYFYLEVKCESTVVTADDDGVGISLPTATAANIATSWTNGFGFGTNNHGYLGGASVGGGDTLAAGDYMCIALDTVHGRALMVKGGSAGTDPNWAGANPPTPMSYYTTWGTDISSVFNNVNACLTALFRTSTADSFTVNNGPTFRYLKPMGHSSGWNGRDYNTPCGFDTASEANIGLKGVGNDYYGFQCGGGGSPTGARAKVAITTSGGKRYIEYWVSNRGGHEIVGICDATYVPGAALGTHFKSPIANTAVSNKHGEIAIDCTLQKMWQRDQHSDGWSPSGDPALGTGGTDISGLTWPVYFACTSTDLSQGSRFCIITDSKGMLNSPPSGFTAGWPTS